MSSSESQLKDMGWDSFFIIRAYRPVYPLHIKRPIMVKLTIKTIFPTTFPYENTAILRTINAPPNRKDSKKCVPNYLLKFLITLYCDYRNRHYCNLCYVKLAQLLCVPIFLICTFCTKLVQVFNSQFSTKLVEKSII